MRGLPPGSKAIPRSAPKPDALTYTKLEVAGDELNTSIRLFFLDRDPISVHVLASACQSILRELAKAKGYQTLSQHTESRVAPEYRADWRRIMSESFNFMKHAGRDADEVMENFDPLLNDMVILENVTTFTDLFKSVSIEGVVFLSWFAAEYPDMLAEDAPSYMRNMGSTFLRHPPHRRRKLALE